MLRRIPFPKIGSDKFPRGKKGFGFCQKFVGNASFRVSQTCLGANVLSGLVPSTVFKKNLWAFLGPCVRGRGRPWYGTSARPESHFTCSSPRCVPRAVPSTFLLHYFGAFLGALGMGEGAPLVQSLKTLSSLNKEEKPLFLSDSSNWSFPSVSSLSDYSIWRSSNLF